MAVTIDKAHIRQFNDNVILLAQQKGSKFRGMVREKPLKGNAAYFDRLAATEAVQKTSRFAPTPNIDQEHSRRRVTPQDWHWASLIDSDDVERMLTSPESDYAQLGAWALGRRIDTIVLEAARGDAYSVDADLAASAAALPSGQKVAVGTTGLTIAKLLSTKEIFWNNDIDVEDPDMQVVFAASPKSLLQLMNSTEVKSADYNAVKALAEGKIDEYMGFKFKRTTRLAKTGNTRFCIAWLKNAIGLAVNGDISTKVSERDDLSYATQVYCETTLGATRVEDEKVVEVGVDESVAY